MKSIAVFYYFLATCIALSSGMICAPEEDVIEEYFSKLAKANNELAFNLHRKLASGTSRNIVFSPLSISTAFGVLFYGARGEAAKELRKTLGYEKAGLLSEFVHDTFGLYFDVLNKKDSSNGYDFHSANAIIADKSTELIEEYSRNVQDIYKVAVLNVEFSRESARIAQEINAWVKKQTNGKIEKILDEFSSATGLVMLNAVYFKGTWKTRFNPRWTRAGVFYNNGLESEAKRVQMMYLEADLPAAFFDDFKVLELPYKGGNLSMLILLPNKPDGLQDLEDSLTPEMLEKILEQMYNFNMEILLPKFKLEFQEELSEPLQTLGAKLLFKPGADFSGMTLSKAVAVNEVLHKAVIEVNEEGSEAVASTGVIMFKSGSLPFRANHPFLFCIIEKGSKSNMVLFMGRVNKL